MCSTFTPQIKDIYSATYLTFHSPQDIIMITYNQTMSQYNVLSKIITDIIPETHKPH